jgi:hypothetical protein
LADDDDLRIISDRIQARAVRRMGGLLKEYDARNYGDSAFNCRLLRQSRVSTYQIECTVTAIPMASWSC